MSGAALQLYGVALGDIDSDKRLLERRLDMAHSAAVLLDKNNLIKYDRRSGNFQVLQPYESQPYTAHLHDTEPHMCRG